jgi:uncharacterized protein (DUF1499 family)
MMPWEVIGLVAVLALAGGVVTLALLTLRSRRPAFLGAHEGRLSSCPGSPNCVSSQAEDDAHRLAPLVFAGDPGGAWARLRAVLDPWPRTRVVTATDMYLHAECTSRVFRFVDDVEFLLDRDAKLIHVRSASRIGHSDLGVNRRRVEAIRQAFERVEP